MTRHYTHTSEAVALAAVASLPSLLGAEAPKSPDAPSPRSMVDAAVVRAIAEQLTKKNVSEIKDALLAMVRAVDAVIHGPVVDVGRQVGPCSCVPVAWYSEGKMMESVSNDKGVSPDSQPRLLRFTADGRPCYAMKWRDERTENRREVDYVIREAGEAVVICLLVDCPLRIPGTPDLVSVVFTGQKIIRAETEWEHAATTWEGGDTDDEGLVRICSTDCFHARGEELRQDLTRMIREYRQGTRKCHDLVPSTTLVDPKPKITIETVAEKVDAIHATAGAIHATAGAIHADTQKLKDSVPAVIDGQAKTIHDHEEELARLKVILSQKIADLFVVYQAIEPGDMKIFLSFIRNGNQVKAAAALGMKEQTLRARVAKWPLRGAAYARIYAVYHDIKETPQKPKIAPNYDKTLFENLAGPDVEAHILKDIAEIIVDMTPANLEVKRKELLTKYLVEYAST